MKKLLLLSVVLLLFAGCSKDETTSSGQADQTEAFVRPGLSETVFAFPLAFVVRVATLFEQLESV